MKIIHVGSHAGVPGILAKYQRETHDVELVYRDLDDPGGTCGYYGYAGYKSPIDPLVQRVRLWRHSRTADRTGGGNSATVQRGRQVANHRYHKEIRNRCKGCKGIIHVHGAYTLLPMIRKVAPDAGIVIHYHGTDRRTGKQEYLKQYEEYADYVLVSTPDLLRKDDHAEWVRNPIDLEHFGKRNKPKEADTAPCIAWLPSDTEEAARRELDRSRPDLKLHYHNRLKDPIPYRDMPQMLSRYGYYLDVKGLDGALDMIASSMIGLQAQAVGRPTLLNGRIVCDQHVLHDGGVVAKRLDEIYSTVRQNA